jgi:hypothetical protein
LKWPVLEDEFRVLDRPDPEDFLRVRLESVGNNRLIEAYMHFNMAIDETIRWQLLQETPIRSITFSDSAFIATDSVYDAIDIAKSVWSRLTKVHVPVRCGVAYGSFVILRFRSDLSLRADTHAAQFVGTGAVWAHAACERSGLKGMRVFLHPSAADTLGDPYISGNSFMKELRHDTMPLGEHEASAHAACEVRQLHEKTHPQIKDIVDRQYWRDVQVMHQTAVNDGAPPDALAHYEATFDALNRMRAAIGRTPLHPMEEFPMERKPTISELKPIKPKAST